MKVEMKKWEIERIKEIIAKILEFYAYDTISAKNSSGGELSMSTTVFFEQLERELKDY